MTVHIDKIGTTTLTRGNLKTIGQLDPEICSGNEMFTDGPVPLNAVKSFNLICDLRIKFR